MTEQDLPALPWGGLSDLDRWLEVRSDVEVQSAVRTYALEATASLRAELEASRAKCALLAAEVEGLRKALQGVMYWDNGKSEWVEARAALSSAAAAPNQGK